MFEESADPMQFRDARIRDKRVQALRSESAGVVKKAVNTLRKRKEGSRAERELIGLVAQWPAEESSAPLWAMVVLKYMRSRRAVPALLSVLDSEADLWKEAAMEALEWIVREHGEAVLGLIEDFIVQRLDHDPFDARLFAYAPIAQASSSERAKQFFISMFEEDLKWQHAMALDLARFQDRKILHVLRRAIERAQRSGDTMSEKGLRYAYCVLDGVKLSSAAHEQDLGSEPWEERWGFQLAALGRTDEEVVAMEAKRFTPTHSDRKLEDIRAEIEHENAIIAAHPLQDFNLDTYLAVRERGEVEEAFEQALRLLGFDEGWHVEDVQKLINQAETPEEVVARLTEGRLGFPSRGSMEEFLSLLQELWSITPRESLQGLSPVDLVMLPELQRQARVVERRLDELRKQFLREEDNA